MAFKTSLTILSDTKYLDLLRQWVTASLCVANKSNFPKSFVMYCTMALIEAVDNAIFHAHDKKRNLPIDVELEVLDDKVTIEVRDCGKGLDHFEAIAPDEMSESGRGLFIIKSVAKKVESKRVGDKHSLRMVFEL